jgi:Ca-activated chloride channel family protein
MSLLLPLGLLGLLTLPIIIFLHLQRERPRRLQVPSVILWQHLASLQPHPEPRRLPLTLLLLLHLLVAALLALALARPVLPGLSGSRASHLIVLLDTSTSMSASALGGSSRLALAQTRLDQLRAALGQDDTLTLITLSPQAQVANRFPSPPPDPLRADAPAPPAAALTAAGDQLDLRNGLNLANGLLDPRRTNRILILSDATWLPESLDALTIPVGAPVTWETLAGPTANQALVAFAARPLPTGGTDLIARVANYADQPVRRTLRVLAPGANGQSETIVADQPLELAPNGEYVGHWLLPATLTIVEAELSGSDAQPADDRASLALTTPATTTDGQPASTDLPVRLVGTESQALIRILAALPGLYLDNDLPPEQAALTISYGTLPDTAPSGATLLINPPSLPAWDQDASPALDTVEQPQRTADPLLYDLDLTGVRFPGPSAQVPPWAEILYQDGYPLLWRGTLGPARIIALNFDLERSNLPTKLAFPVLMARIITELTPIGVPTSITLGEALTFPWPASDFRVLGPAGEPLPITDAGRNRVVRALQPGLHTVELAGRPVARFAAQAGNPLESDLRPTQRDNLPTITQVPIREQGPSAPVRDLAPWLVAMVLALLTFEQLYERVRLAR